MTQQAYEHQQQLNESPQLTALQELEAEVELEGFAVYHDPHVDVPDLVTGLTKLQAAAMKQDKDRAKHLIVQGANTEVVDPKTGDTPLLSAVKYGNYYPASELLRAHANHLHVNKYGMNALHIAIAQRQPVLADAIIVHDSTLRKGVWAKFYPDLPSLVNSRMTNGPTALMMASQDGLRTVVERLVGYRADLNFQTQTGDTALMYASITGNKDIVDILLYHGADPFLKNNMGFTPFMMASQRGHTSTVKEFLKYIERDSPRLDDLLDMRDYVSYSALDLASLEGHQDVVDTLIIAGAERSKYSSDVSKEVMEERRLKMSERDTGKMKKVDAEVRKDLKYPDPTEIGKFKVPDNFLGRHDSELDLKAAKLELEGYDVSY